MTTEGILALILGLVIGGVAIPWIINSVRAVRQARGLIERYNQLGEQYQQTTNVFRAVLANIANEKGEYRITKTGLAKADKIGDVNWRVQKGGALVISTEPRKDT